MILKISVAVRAFNASELLVDKFRINYARQRVRQNFLKFIRFLFINKYYVSYFFYYINYFLRFTRS